MRTTTRTSITAFLVLLFAATYADRSAPAQYEQSDQESQLTVPNRANNPLYKGEQGAQKSEVDFAPLTRTVTIKCHVEDPNGYFLPNLRRGNFAVYEDGVRQENVNVDVEHAPVTVALLLEFGGRYRELNRSMAIEITQMARQFLDRLNRDDKVAVFKYNSKLEIVVDFNQNRDVQENALDQLGTPPESELNFYDALLETENRMRDLSGRKAIVVISSGLDTFSKASYQQTLQAAQRSETTIYTIGLIKIIRREAVIYGPTAPFSRIDWDNAEKQLQGLARTSGGRIYEPRLGHRDPSYLRRPHGESARPLCDHVCVVESGDSWPTREIRVELIDPKTGGPLKIHDATGKVVAARVYVQATYTPKNANDS